MSIKEKLYRYISNKILSRVAKLNRVEVSDLGAISSTATLKGCVLLGDIRIGDYAKVMSGVKMRGHITIGKNTSVSGPNTDLLAEIHPIHIGNFCSIARNVSFQEYNHRYKRLTSYFVFLNVFNERTTQDIDSKGKIEIGHDVWIGTGCIILSGVAIGHGAVIAANSVVSSDIPPYTIAAGSPARPVKPRFSPEIVAKLLELNWWDWSHDKIKKNRHLFEEELSLEKLSRIY